MPKKVAVGVVTSDKMQKTRRVEIPRLVKHPVYGKYIRQRTVCHVHDEDEASSMGDTVEIIETQPRSKLKRWDLVRVVNKNSEADLAALRAAREIAEVDEQVASEPAKDEATEKTAAATGGEDESPESGESTGTEEADGVTEGKDDNNPTETEAAE